MENIILALLFGFVCVLLFSIQMSRVISLALGSVLVIQDFGTGYRIWLENKAIKRE